ncbi:MAG: 2-C-methyl-D-erythritol 2,4-cyclodiphosphate synthase [Firmicutes bacterium]|nr:2-C-methyl-D-erythritol 2,4-cyclodiphosphate synthase [Bacillota bacterium]
MFNGKKVAVIIAAGGFGSRLGADKPKQFISIGGKPMLRKTVDVFDENVYVDGICVVTNKDYIKETKSMLQGTDKPIYFIVGGKERQDSVASGLRAIGSEMSDYELVLIHDAARPYVTNAIIEDCLRNADAVGAAVAGVPVKDTIRYIGMTLERKDLTSVQTPQGFRRNIIEKAYEKAYSDGYYGTDDGSIVERLGLQVAISAGDYANIKITTREDLPMDRRAGTGFDVHQLVEGRPCILGGVNVPFEKGLLGHSDADVLTHAIMDALLGAAGLGDIGRHFPDTDQKYAGISSMRLLREVREMLASKGYRPINIDACVICERPKVAPHIDKMKENIARELGMDPSDVNIKGTTTEKLGFTGRGEGIAATAICMIEGELTL